MLKNNLGWADNDAAMPGELRLTPLVSNAGKRSRPANSWGSLHAASAVNADDFCRDPKQRWFSGKEVISRISDRCFVGSWVFCNTPKTREIIVGRIAELLVEHDVDALGIAVIDVFAIAATRHKTFGMPYLIRRQANPAFTIVHTKDVEFNFNTQHDCSFAGCGPTGSRPRMQERIKSSKETESFIEHCDVPRWIINIHSLHNGHLLRRCLPRDLTLPVPIIDPAKHEGEHCKIATAYRPKQDAKRADQAAKKQASK